MAKCNNFIFYSMLNCYKRAHSMSIAEFLQIIKEIALARDREKGKSGIQGLDKKKRKFFDSALHLVCQKREKVKKKKG
jgi:hypothetical protein